jgi:thymidylate kinase
MNCEKVITGQASSTGASQTSGPNIEDFLCALFRVLDAQQIRYCVLHGWDLLPRTLTSDLDIAVHPDDKHKLARVFGALRDKGFLPVQCLNYAVNGFYFVFYWFRGMRLDTIAVDIIFEHRRNGIRLSSGIKLVSNRRRHDCFWVADPGVQFEYLLAKKTFKGSVPPRSQLELAGLLRQIGSAKANDIASQLYGSRWSEMVVRACLEGNLATLIPVLRRALWRHSVRRHPLEAALNTLGECRRVLSRWFQPTGVFLVVLGPDGVGKSTLVGQLVENLGPAFRRHRVFHWRPQVLKPQRETGMSVSAPHAEPLRGSLQSALRLFVFFADYWVGHLLVTRPLLARSGLVVFDRYFHDITIDRQRYRYGGPMWLPKFLAQFVPPPDLLLLVLTADTEVILSRKREVAPEQLEQLRDSYNRLSAELYPAGLINTGAGIEHSVFAATNTIARHLAKRFEHRHRYWITPPRLEEECDARVPMTA